MGRKRISCKIPRRWTSAVYTHGAAEVAEAKSERVNLDTTAERGKALVNIQLSAAISLVPNLELKVRKC